MTQSNEFTLASRWRRLGASFLDAIALMILNFVFSTFFLLLLHFSGVINLRTDKTLAQFFGQTMGMIFCFSYFLVFTLMWHATPGKRILGLKVLSEDSSVLSTKQVLLRELLGRWGGVLVLGNLWLLFNKRKKTASDFVAKTLVVKIS